MTTMAKSLPAGERKRPPLHPGQIIGGILEEQGISARTCALAIGMTPQALGNVLNGKSPVTPSTALRIGVYFGNGPDLWLNLQADYDVHHAKLEFADVLRRIEPLPKEPLKTARR
jgi:antitoxin HigA-1